MGTSTAAVQYRRSTDHQRRTYLISFYLLMVSFRISYYCNYQQMSTSYTKHWLLLWNVEMNVCFLRHSATVDCWYLLLMILQQEKVFTILNGLSCMTWYISLECICKCIATYKRCAVAYEWYVLCCTTMMMTCCSADAWIKIKSK